MIPDHDWIDHSKFRKTFYGPTPFTANQMIQHVDNVQAYYLSRIGLDLNMRPDSLVENRQECLDLLTTYFYQRDLDEIHSIDNELWTLPKVLRRLIWHDLIHARALYRLGLKIAPEIVKQREPFLFSLVDL